MLPSAASNRTFCSRSNSRDRRARTQSDQADDDHRRHQAKRSGHKKKWSMVPVR